MEGSVSERVSEGVIYYSDKGVSGGGGVDGWG